MAIHYEIWRNGKEGPNGGKGQKRGEEYQKKYDYPFCHIKILLFPLPKKKPWIISRTGHLLVIVLLSVVEEPLYLLGRSTFELLFLKLCV